MGTNAVREFSKPSQHPINGDRTPPVPVTSPAPSYSPKASAFEENSTLPSLQTAKRRPLSSSSPNPGRSQGLQSPLRNGVSNTSRTPSPRKTSYESGDDAYMRKPARELENWEPLTDGPVPVTQSISYRPFRTIQGTSQLQEPQSAIISTVNGSESDSRHTSGGSYVSTSGIQQGYQPLQYHHQIFETDGRSRSADSSASQNQERRSSEQAPPVPSHAHISPGGRALLGANLQRPSSAYSSGSELGVPGRARSPGQYARTLSPSRLSPDSRPMSYIDLLNVPYPQPPPAPSSIDNAHLRSAVGQNASLLSTKKTLDMYRANVKKTSDPTIQYEFAVFMVNAALELPNNGKDEDSGRQPSPNPSTQDLEGPTGDSLTAASSKVELLRESRHILQKLSDRSYPFAQYYLGDGYASGLFSKGVEDNDRAFPLFVAASKHGHAEAGYRAALCYEFGWGSRKDPQKAVQFYRQSASKNHPGAMARLGKACLVGDMGLGNRYREGLKWLKRAAESADFQYNSAPYELGLLHETGYGDDIFQDKSYAAQLFTQSADLGHVEANYRLGDSYEHGKLRCPKDPALSVHFYTGAAQRGHPLAMMALCAWYMVGAEPVLEKDENEAYEWARKAAETGKCFSSDLDPRSLSRNFVVSLY